MGCAPPLLQKAGHRSAINGPSRGMCVNHWGAVLHPWIMAQPRSSWLHMTSMNAMVPMRNSGVKWLSSMWTAEKGQTAISPAILAVVSRAGLCMLLLKSLAQTLHHSQVAAWFIRDEARVGCGLLQTIGRKHEVMLSNMWYSS